MKHHSESELKRFKTEIDLVSFLGSQGYEIDRERSTDQHASMKHLATSARAVVTRGEDGHWTYFNPLDDADSGTIIDWMRRHITENLGEIRKRLRQTLGEPPDPPAAYTTPVRRSKPDARRGLADWERAEDAQAHGYLDGRGIPRNIQNHPRFRDSWRVLSHKGFHNVAFPYTPEGQTSGVGGVEQRFEMPDGSSGRYFTKRGSKGLWLSEMQPDDERTVIVEAPLDAMSHASLSSPIDLEATSYIATGGQISESNLVALAQELEQRGHEVVLALDNDDPGRAHRGRIAAALESRGLGYTQETPQQKDWTDDLRTQIEASVASVDTETRRQYRTL